MKGNLLGDLGKAALAALVLLTTGCNDLNLGGGNAKPPYDMVDANGEPYCGGYTDLGFKWQYAEVLYQRKTDPRLFPSARTAALRNHSSVKGLVNPVRPSWDQGVLPNGLVPMVVPFEQVTWSSVPDPFPEFFARGWWNAPLTQIGPAGNPNSVIRQGFMVLLFDPQTLQFVKGSTYGWANGTLAMGYAAGRDGYLYVAGVTFDQRPLGGGTTTFVPYDESKKTQRVYVMRINPNTLEPGYKVYDLTAVNPWAQNNDAYPLSVLHDPATNTVLVGLVSQQGRYFIGGVNTANSQMAWLQQVGVAPSRLFWAEGKEAGREVYAVTEDELCWIGTCYALPQGLHVGRYRLTGSGVSAVWERHEFTKIYKPARIPDGQIAYIRESTNEYEASARVLSAAPAPEGGVNFHLQLYLGALRDPLLRTKFTEWQVLRENAERGYYNTGDISYLGRIAPDGTVSPLQEERLMPPDRTPYKISGAPQEDMSSDGIRESSSVMFLDGGGRTAVLFGTGGHNALCYYRWAFETEGAGLQLFQLDVAALGLILKRNWNPGDKITGPNVRPYTNVDELIREHAFVNYMQYPQVYIPLGNGLHLAYFSFTEGVWTTLFSATAP